ncbi:MAG: beta-Ala-His dipeptidase, partial [Lachnospiraceae bacterium]|nr:beta-Ala-His dipeptidase [Lachnospiraceae bacterium]
MGVLDGLKPAGVFRLFEEISRIPRGSGNEKQISDYLKKFAEDRGLTCIQDASHNIIIIKEAAPGYEQEAPYILQGHMDMVTVKKPDCEIDMKKDPLHLCIRDGRVCAEGTSLGGDDGIAVAYILALLDAQDIRHPRLEMVVTTEEETGLTGAKNIDLSMLRGRQLINLDNEEEGVIITSCAGGARVDVQIPLQWETMAEGTRILEIKVQGLQGGHSGSEIDKGRGNANCLLGRILMAAAKESKVRLAALQGGQADNAIPREAGALFAVTEEEKTQVLDRIGRERDRIKGELQNTDQDFCVLCMEIGSDKNLLQENCADNSDNNKFDAEKTEKTGELYHDGRQMEPKECLTLACTERALSCLTSLPDGIVAMSDDVEGLVQTSLNLGIMGLDQEMLQLSYAVRSSVDQEKEELCRRMQEIARKTGASVQVRSAYPGWAYRKESPLRDRLSVVYERMYGRKPQLQAIHA